MMLSSIVMIAFMTLIIPFLSRAQDHAICEGTLPATMKVEDVGYVTDTGANNVRDRAGTDGSILGTLQVGERFTIISSSVCVDGTVWYQIENENISGWTAESGDGDYWLLPSNDEVTVDLSNIQHIRDITCENKYGLHSFSFSQSGESLLIACGGDRSTLLIYDMALDRIVEEVDMSYATNVQSAHYVAGDRLILAVYSRNTVALLDAVTFERIQEITYGSFIPSTSLSLDRTLFFRIDNESRNTVHVHDATNLEWLTSFIHPSANASVSVVTDNYHSRILLRPGVLLTLDSELNIINQKEIPYDFSVISPDMDIAIAAICTHADHGCQSAEIRWLDLDTMETVFVTVPDDVYFGNVSFLPDGSAFLLGECGYPRLYNTEYGGGSVVEEIEISCSGQHAVSSEWRYIATEQKFDEDGEPRVSIKIYRLGDA